MSTATKRHPVSVEWYGGPHDGATVAVLPAAEGQQPIAVGEVVYMRDGSVVGRFERRCPLILRPLAVPHPLGMTHRAMADWTQGEWVEG